MTIKKGKETSKLINETLCDPYSMEGIYPWVSDYFTTSWQGHQTIKIEADLFPSFAKAWGDQRVMSWGQDTYGVGALWGSKKWLSSSLHRIISVF